MSYNALTGEATGDFITMYVEMKLTDTGFKVTKIRNRQKEANPQCYAIVSMPSIDVTFPFIEMPLYVEIGGKEKRVGSDIFSGSFSYHPDIERFTINDVQYLGHQE
jgi:hypothetical protein